MKKPAINFIATLILITLVSFSTHAQTNVSGGVFTNTIWTLANSPYIVIDTTVVFPGVTLTIEPGVTVRFDDAMYLEIRQATLIAIGTATDSITFTSNSLVPAPGIWGHGSQGGLWISGSAVFNFCNFEYATSGIRTANNLPYIKNSSFTKNGYGVYNLSNTPVDSCIFKFNDRGIGYINGGVLNYCTISNNNYGVEDFNNATFNNCIIDSNINALEGSNSAFHNCSISYNRYGIICRPQGNLLNHCVINSNIVRGIILMSSFKRDTIINCEIKYNGTGIVAQTSQPSLITQCEIEYDTIGILINKNAADFFCNKICNNISYSVQMNTSANFNISDNYWCTTDSATIAAAIYDAYDNVIYGLVTFMPIDTSQCYIVTGVSTLDDHTLSFTIFPNPAADYLTVALSAMSSLSEIKIFSMLGELVYTAGNTSEKTTIDISTLVSGAYIVQVGTQDGISRQKLIRQ